MTRLILPALATVLLVACGGTSDSADAAATNTQPAVEPTPATAPAATPAPSEDSAPVALDLAAADLTNGARQYRRCQSCHTIDEGGRNTVGPNLYGVVGSPAASREGFSYSRQLTEAGLVWDIETLNAWIENPRALVPGNRMSFVGLRNAEDRRDVIAYIASQTGTTGE